MGQITGRHAIGGFYRGAFTALPQADFTLPARVFADDALLISSRATSTAARIENAVDTFVFADELIRRQTTVFDLQTLTEQARDTRTLDRRAPVSGRPRSHYPVAQARTVARPRRGVRPRRARRATGRGAATACPSPGWLGTAPTPPSVLTAGVDHPERARTAGRRCRDVDVRRAVPNPPSARGPAWQLQKPVRPPLVQPGSRRSELDQCCRAAFTAQT